MKRFLTLVLAVSMLLVMVGCSSGSSSAPVSTPSAPTSVVPTPKSTDPKVESKPVVDFPKREIKLIVPWSAGGANDINARFLQQIFKDKFDVDLVVENIAGGSSAVGITQAMQADPDGYTLGYASSSYIALIAQGMVDLTVDNMDLIGVAVEEPITMYTKTNGKYSTLKEVLDANKAAPGTVNFGKSGTFTSSYVFSSLIQKQADTQFNVVPFDGASRVVTEILGGHMDVGMSNLGDIMSQVNEGEILPLVVFSENRSDVIPDTPTAAELGYDVFKLGKIKQASFVMAPKGLDPAVKQELIRMFNEAVASDEYQKFAKERGFTVPELNEEELAKYIQQISVGFEAAAKEFPMT